MAASPIVGLCSLLLTSAASLQHGIRPTATARFPPPLLRHSGGGQSSDVAIHTDGTTMAVTDDAPDVTMRELISFTVPLLGIGLATPLLSLVDSAIVGRCGSAMQLACMGREVEEHLGFLHWATLGGCGRVEDNSGTGRRQGGDRAGTG